MTQGLAFEELRPRLVGLAYRLLGSMTDAEDMVQEAFVRWHSVDQDRIEVPAAWLTRVVTNLCLNTLASARVQRESYVGPWLPEPVLTGGGVLGPLDTVEQRDSVSLGLLMLLERLSPAERAVFVLREAFVYGHAEIAEVLEISEEHSRQLLARARRHVGDEERRRFVADSAQHRRIVEQFFAAVLGGEVEVLEKLLAADVIATADGGGTTAARRPIVGQDTVLRYLLGLGRRPEAAAVTAEVAEVNGQAAVLLRFDGALRAVMSVTVDKGEITAVHTVINPAKLAFAATQAGTV